MTTRRDELLEATAEYILEHGVSDLSLRPLARAIGTRARLLIYHFGSRDALVSAALSLLLRRVQQAFLAMHSSATLDRTLIAFWHWALNDENQRHLRLVFEVHGLAPRHPSMYGDYAREALESWRMLIAGRIGKRGVTRRRREELATIIIGVVDGLLMDYLATGDRLRTTRALTLFVNRLKKSKGGAL